MSKRLLSALVALCMALTLMPSWAFADEPGEEPKDPPAENAGEVLDGEEDKEKDPEPAEGSKEETPKDSDGETPKEDSEETPKAPDGKADSEVPNQETPETSEEETPAPEEDEEVSVTMEIPLSIDSDRLLMDYIENTLGVKEENTPAPASNGMRKVGRRIAQPVTRESLDSDQKVIYDALKEMIDRVVQSGGSTEVTLGSASDIVKGAFSGDTDQTNRLQAVVLALQNDCAEKLYWYGHSISSYSSGTKVAMAVAEVYQTGNTTDPDDDGDYELNSSLILQLNTALKNAKTWADEINTAGGTDFDKLLAAGMKICEAVDYHPVGNGKEHFSPLDNSNPWEIIHVFDNDPSTKVVCEGYSKAFQYLCRMMSLDEAQCYTVTGQMNGGDHMWNIVRLDGKSYLVDVTNSDDEAAGSHFRLFMKGYIADPSTDEDYNNVIDGTPVWSEKYTSADNVTGKSYVIATGRYILQGGYNPSMGIKYAYDEATLDLYNADILTLTDADYEPPKVLTGELQFFLDQMGVANKDNITEATYESGHSLVVSYIGTEQGLENPAVEWYRGDDPTPIYTRTPYALQAADAGHPLKVVFTYEGYLPIEATINVIRGSAVAVRPTLSYQQSGNRIVVDNIQADQQYVFTTTQAGFNATSAGWLDGSTPANIIQRNPVAGTTYYVATRVKASANGGVAGDVVWSEGFTMPGAPTAGAFTIGNPSVTYTGQPQAAEVAAAAALGDVSVKYRQGNSAATATAPTNAGTYTVLVTTTNPGSGYLPVTDLNIGTFTITKAHPTLTISGGTSVSVGSHLELTVAVSELPQLASEVQWSSNNNHVTVPSRGKTIQVDGLTAGTTQVTATLRGTANYDEARAQVTITVSSKPVQRIAFNSSTMELQIGETATNILSVLPPENESGDIGAVTYSSSNPEIATVDSEGEVTALKKGTATITATVAETDDFGSASATYELTVVTKRIQPPTLTIIGGPWTYNDGKPIEPEVTVTAQPEDGVVLTEADYEITYENNVNAGTTATVKVTPKGENFTWDVADSTATFEISKAASAAASVDVKQRFDAAALTVDLKTVLTDAQKLGATFEHAEISAVTSSDLVFLSAPTVTSVGILSYTLTPGLTQEQGEAGHTATFTVTFPTQNYDAVTVTVVVKLTALPKPLAPTNVTLSYAQTSDTEYTVTATATPDPEFADTALQYSKDDGLTWQEANTFTVDAGASITVVARTKAVEDVNVESEKSGPASCVTPPAFSPNGGTFRGSQDVTLAAPGAGPEAKIYYTTNGQELDPSLENGTEYTEAIKLTSTTTITAYLVDEAGNIGPHRSVTFTRRSSSSGGSSSSGESIVISGGSGSTSGSGSTKPSTTPSTPGVSSGSGSTTAAPSATVKDGTASATVGGTLGKDLVDQAAANGSDTVVVAPSIPSSADQTDVSIGSSVVSDLVSRTDADLRVETPAADVTISNRGLSGLAGKGGSVVVSTSAKGDTFDISITAGGSKVDRVTGGVKVEIPTSCTPGTVAMVTKADGTTELVRKSVANASYGTVTVPLEGSATITLMDNSKSFRDVPAGNTFAGAVAFVSSREIMSGTGADTFNPSAPLTRAQLAKILHNLESNPSAAVSGAFSDVAGGFWSAEAIQWASDKGIVTGYADGTFKPNNYITREQLAVMLYRYAGSPNIRSSELRFSDAASVGSYAQAAMIWATQNGVINGSGGMLNPKGQATRAQAAQMLLNYMNNVG